MNFKEFLVANPTYWTQFWNKLSILSLSFTDTTLNLIVQNAFTYRYNYEEMLYDIDEFWDRMLIEFTNKQAFIFEKVYNEMISVLNSNKLLYDRFVDRDYSGSNTFSELTRPLDMSDITNGVSDYVDNGTNSGSEDVYEYNKPLFENFNKLSKNFANALRNFVESFAYLFRRTF